MNKYTIEKKAYSTKNNEHIQCNIINVDVNSFFYHILFVVYRE